MKAVKILLCVLVASLLVVPAAVAEINWSANMRSQWTVESASNGADTMSISGGDRLLLTLESKTENEEGMYAAGKGQALLKTDGTAAVDDAWLELGTSSFSVKLGRFEAEGLFAKGEDVFVIEAPGGPGTVETNKSRGRTNAGAAIKFSPSETMAIEIATALGGADDYQETAVNQVGFRPALILSAGALSASVGADYYMLMPQDSDLDTEYTALGAGGKLEFSLSDTITLGGAFGYLDEEGKDAAGDTVEEETTMSFSGYLTMAMGDSTLGVGAMMTMRDEADDSHLQGFVSYAMPLPVEGATVKFCPSFASYSNGEDTSAFGGRVRFEYDF
jgi:hypothetical protein